MSYFFILFNLFILFSAIGLLVTKNPIYAILYLIYIFINVTAILLLFQIEFLGILFLIVYLGAIVILFLFIIMFLNIKLITITENIIKYTPFTCFFLISLFLIFFLVFSFNYNDLSSTIFYVNWYSLINNKTNLLLLGILIYNFYFDYLFVAGILLFVAILGIVCLTLKVELDIASKRQNISFQLRNSIITSLSFSTKN